MAPRAGALLYRLGNVVAWLAFISAGLVVAHPGENSLLWLVICCASAILAWALGRAALYLLARR
mgnify:CR=1 FL=1